MGYYTYYELEVYQEDISISNILEGLSDSDPFYGLNYAFDMTGSSEESVKWYSHEKEMKWLSEQHPNIVFQLSGEGEEAGDMWHKYFKNGKMQFCPAQIVFDNFDEKLLEQLD